MHAAREFPRRAQRDERGGLCTDRHERRSQRRRRRSRSGRWRIDRRGGRRRDAVAARQARSRCSPRLAAHPGKAHTLGRCRIEPMSGRLGVFREVQRQRSARDASFCRGCGRCGTIAFRIELRSRCAGAGRGAGRSASPAGASSKSARHWQRRCRGLPGGPCPPAGEARFSWDFRCLGRRLGVEPAAFACRATFVSARPRRAERRIAQAVEKACTSLR